MNPVLEEAYSTVLSGAPFVIGAYALIWAILCAFVVVMLARSRKTAADIDALRQAVSRLEARADADQDAAADGPRSDAATTAAAATAAAPAATTDQGAAGKRSLEDAIGR